MSLKSVDGIRRVAKKTIVVHQRHPVKIAAGYLVLFGMCLSLFGVLRDPQPVYAATIIVNSAADSTVDADGECTLREAINNSNTGSDTTGGDCIAGDGSIETINFNIAGGGVQTIDISGNGPLIITDRVTIDASTQTGTDCSAHHLKVVVDGGGLSSNIFTVSVTAVHIRGFVISGAVDAAVDFTLLPTGSGSLTCSNVGTNATGTAVAVNQNQSHGISFAGSAGVTIGGSNAGDGNVISGNGGSGIVVTSTGVSATIKGNMIGVDATGLSPIANNDNAISIAATNATVGGTTESEGNIIHGTVLLIADGSAPDAVAINGVTIRNNTITSSGNGGIFLWSKGASNNLIQNISILENTLTDFSGSVPAIHILGHVSDVLVGNDTTGGNTVSGSSGLGGILVTKSSSTAGDYAPGFSPANISILGNSIFNSTGLGIDLAEDAGGDITPDTHTGTDTNDALDADTGPNDYLNHPVIVQLAQNGADTDVTYTLDVPVSGFPYRVEFFKNPSGIDASGYGEGETYVDFDQVTPGVGEQTFTKTLASTNLTDTITATITPCLDVGCTLYGGTSEFSNNAPTEPEETPTSDSSQSTSGSAPNPTPVIPPPVPTPVPTPTPIPAPIPEPVPTPTVPETPPVDDTVSPVDVSDNSLDITTVSETLVSTTSSIPDTISETVSVPQLSVGAFVPDGAKKITQAVLPFIASIIYLTFDYSRRLLGIPWYRRKRYWGVVYDSQTGQPIDPVYVTLKDAQGNEVATAISDLSGRYGFVADPGIYTLTAGKTNYVFPSTHPEMFMNTYPDPYLGTPITLSKDTLIMQNIPMDPVGHDWNQEAKESMFSRMKSSKIFQSIGATLFFASGVFTLYSLITNPNTWNIIVTIWMIALVVYTSIQSKPIQAFGSITKSKTPLDHAKITLINPRTKTTVLSRTTNRDGHYFFLAENGEYDATIAHDTETTNIPYEVTKGVGDVEIKI